MPLAEPNEVTNATLVTNATVARPMPLAKERGGSREVAAEHFSSSFQHLVPVACELPVHPLRCRTVDVYLCGAFVFLATRHTRVVEGSELVKMQCSAASAQ